MLLKSTVVFFVVAAACSSGDKKVSTPQLPPPDASTEVADGELCKKLVVRITDEDKSGDTARRDKVVAIITEHCPTWPTDVQRCLVTSPEDSAEACFQKLDADKREKFLLAVKKAMSAPPDCDMVVGIPARWVELPQHPDLGEPDHARMSFVVHDVVADNCKTDGWTEEARICVGEATGDPLTCLTPASKEAIEQKLAPRSALFVKGATFKAADPKIACAKVVAAHYGDAQWKDKMTDAKPAARKKAIAAAKAAMTKACKGETWTGFARGCVISAKTAEERSWCIDADRWSYPPAPPPDPITGVTFGIPECDAYVDAVNKAIACDSVPLQARRAVKEGFESAAKQLGAVPEDKKAAAASACKTGTEALREGFKKLGCNF